MSIATKYDLKGTAKKTAVSNGLQFKKSGKSNFLFDFSALETLDTFYKDGIVKQVMNDSSIISDYHYINIDKDRFSCLNGNLHVKRLTVYNDDGKQIYIIFDIAYADLKELERTSIYNDYDVKNDIQVKVYNNTQIESVDFIQD